MSYKKDLSYHDIPFSSETPQEDFFISDAVPNLHAKCESNKDNVIKMRTVGILRNNNGRFYINEMINSNALPCQPNPRDSIQVSMAYMTRSVRFSGMPYPVQLFGSLQWYGRPVIFAQIVQPLSVAVATLLHETMDRVPTFQCSRGSIKST